jgi:hypothetical protein
MGYGLVCVSLTPESDRWDRLITVRWAEMRWFLAALGSDKSIEGSPPHA